jgi:hypothetical protein
MLVYAVIMEWEFRGDHGTSFKLYQTREKAQEMLEQFKQEEIANSWINEIEDMYDLENYDDELEYFDCAQYDRRTTIWIEEKVVE